MIASRIEQRTHWCQAESVLDGCQPPRDPDRESLVSVGDGIRIYAEQITRSGSTLPPLQAARRRHLGAPGRSKSRRRLRRIQLGPSQHWSSLRCGDAVTLVVKRHGRNGCERATPCTPQC
jgi:hypothetical protein